MKQLAENIETVFLCPLPMDPLTPEQETEFHHITHCHICEQPFDISNNRVRDHDHLTGIYRGAAHEGCNINYQDSHSVP
ncbi:Recombination endonuclease VII [Popillia japonica]|uniref:Recombination endonuclease VII n=1 Tax=Popillia japonica TaxID=7064 RepID=A0AAW1IZL9_POPJA